jgi:hypothetical protein
MNSATSASLSNTSSQQAFGSSAANAGTTAPAFSSAGSTTSEDSFSKDATDQQAPKEKKRTWPKVLAAIAGVLTLVGLGFLTRSAIRNGHIAEQVEAFNKLGNTKMKTTLDEHFKLEKGSIKTTYEEGKGMRDADAIDHPKAYAYMLDKLFRMEGTDQTKYFTELKLGADHHTAVKKWIETKQSESKKEKTESSES